jgi:hypothetical protein
VSYSGGDWTQCYMPNIMHMGHDTNPERTVRSVLISAQKRERPDIWGLLRYARKRFLFGIDR